MNQSLAASSLPYPTLPWEQWGWYLRFVLLFWSGLNGDLCREFDRRSLGEYLSTSERRSLAVNRILEMQQKLCWRSVWAREGVRAMAVEEEDRRFNTWVEEHSRPFRNLLNLHPDWIARFGDPQEDQERLLAEIEVNLYQEEFPHWRSGKLPRARHQVERPVRRRLKLVQSA